jgi:hypothetical protein
MIVEIGDIKERQIAWYLFVSDLRKQIWWREFEMVAFCSLNVLTSTFCRFRMAARCSGVAFRTLLGKLAEAEVCGGGTGGGTGLDWWASAGIWWWWCGWWWCGCGCWLWCGGGIGVDAEADDASLPLRWSEPDEEGGMGCGMLGGRYERDGRGWSLLRDARGGEFSGELFPLLFEPDEDECLAGGAMLLLFFLSQNDVWFVFSFLPLEERVCLQAGLIVRSIKQRNIASLLSRPCSRKKRILSEIPDEDPLPASSVPSVRSLSGVHLQPLRSPFAA